MAGKDLDRSVFGRRSVQPTVRVLPAMSVTMDGNDITVRVGEKIEGLREVRFFPQGDGSTRVELVTAGSMA